jgi:hypothetical protein
MGQFDYCEREKRGERPPRIIFAHFAINKLKLEECLALLLTKMRYGLRLFLCSKNGGIGIKLLIEKYLNIKNPKNSKIPTVEDSLPTKGRLLYQINFHTAAVPAPPALPEGPLPLPSFPSPFSILSEGPVVFGLE